MDGDGKVLFTPEREHGCAPGWTQGDPVRDRPGYSYANPPEPGKYPKGTVWECPCGLTWVSTGPIAPNSPGFIDFRRERRGERRRREKRQAAG